VIPLLMARYVLMAARWGKKSCIVWAMSDEFVGCANEQIDQPLLVRRLDREDIYQRDHDLLSSPSPPTSLPVRDGNGSDKTCCAS
jgi:hypothetical protein